jgi:predicted TPR repeat methyltransferase
MNNWKEFLYDSYVSSGQSGYKGGDIIKNFGSAKPYADTLISNFFPNDKSAYIVDLGCGTGSVLYHIKEKGYTNIIGIDVSQQQVDIAHLAGLEFIKKQDLIEFLNNTKDNTIDVFMLLDVIEHMTREELFSIFSLLYAKLKIGGKVIIHVPNSEGIFGSKIRYADLTHELAFNTKSLAQLSSAFGFSELIAKEDKPIPHNLTSTIRRWLWNLLTIKYRILHLTETGSYKVILSQNLTACIIK